MTRLVCGATRPCLFSRHLTLVLTLDFFGNARLTWCSRNGASSGTKRPFIAPWLRCLCLATLSSEMAFLSAALCTGLSSSAQRDRGRHQPLSATLSGWLNA